MFSVSCEIYFLNPTNNRKDFKYLLHLHVYRISKIIEAVEMNIYNTI